MPSGVRHNIRLRLEGIDVDFDTAEIYGRSRGPSTATVSLPPTLSIRRILPGTLVHIFYYDGHDKDWHLLFEGETSGRTRTKNESQQSAAIHADGVTNHWSRAWVYMLNDSLGFDYSDQVRMKGIATNKSYSVSERVVDLSAALLSGNIEGSFKKILTVPSQIGNPFYTDVYRRLRLMDRCVALPDPQVSKLFASRNHFEEIFETLVRSSVSEVAPIATLAESLAHMLYYGWTELTSPSSMASSVIFKPTPYFCPIPRCNVFFPSRHGGLGPDSRYFYAEPTRAILLAGPGRTVAGDGEINLGDIIRVAPASLQAAIDGIGNKSASDALQALQAITTQTLTPEEQVKGVIPMYISLSTSEWVVAQAAQKQAADNPDPLAYLSNITQYRFELARVEPRQQGVNNDLMPEVVAGMPGAALDTFGPILGYVDSYVHNVTQEMGTTNVTITHYLDPNDSDIPGADAFPELPPWFSTQYSTGAAYQGLIGSPPLAASAADCVAPLADLLAQHDASTDPNGFARDVTRRPIVTEKDFYQFLGVGGGPDDPVLSGGPFRAANQVAIKAHVDFLSKRRGILAP